MACKSWLIVVWIVVDGWLQNGKKFKNTEKAMLLVKMITEKPENILFITKGSHNLIHEDGRTVGSGRLLQTLSKQ